MEYAKKYSFLKKGEGKEYMQCGLLTTGEYRKLYRYSQFFCSLDSFKVIGDTEELFKIGACLIIPNSVILLLTSKFQI